MYTLTLQWLPKNAARPQNTLMWLPHPGAVQIHKQTVMRAHTFSVIKRDSNGSDIEARNTEWRCERMLPARSRVYLNFLNKCIPQYTEVLLKPVLSLWTEGFRPAHHMNVYWNKFLNYWWLHKSQTSFFFSLSSELSSAVTLNQPLGVRLHIKNPTIEKNKCYSLNESARVTSYSSDSACQTGIVESFVLFLNSHFT